MYFLVLLVLLFLGFMSWYANLWGFSDVVLIPIYALGLVLYGGLILVDHYFLRARNGRLGT